MTFGMIIQKLNMVKKTKLCQVDRDSFIMYIKRHDSYKDIEKDIENRFDTSNYVLDQIDRYQKGKIKKQLN